MDPHWQSFLSNPLPLCRRAAPAAAGLPHVRRTAVTASIAPRCGFRGRAALPVAGTFVLLLLLAVAVQLWMGAFSVEHGLYSDDASHFMNGLLVRGYLSHALGANPLRFAETYYLHYPKIAPLMWPPLFHVVFGVALLLGAPAGVTALLLIAASSAWVAFRLFLMVTPLAGRPSAVAAVALFFTTPLVMSMTSVVMLDVVIAALSIEAAWWLARFARSSSTRDAAVFGVFTALACLTKGNGVATVLIPVFLIAVTGQYDLLRRPGLYVAAAIVLIGAVPVLAVSASLDAGIGDFGPLPLWRILQRLQFYGHQLDRNLGTILCALAVIGAIAAIARRRRRPATDAPLAEALLALAAAGIGFHVFSPHIVSVSRYMTMAVAPIVGLALTGLAAVIPGKNVRIGRLSIAPLVVAAVAMLAVAQRSAIAPLSPLGYRDLIAQLHDSAGLAGRRVLVVSDEVGEGAAVTEAALLGLDPAPTIVRGSKLLARGDWGTIGALTHPTPELLLRDLEDLHIEYVVLDFSPASAALPYFSQVRQITAGGSPPFEQLDGDTEAEIAGEARNLQLYHLTRQTPGEAKPIRIDLEHTLGRVLEEQ